MKTTHILLGGVMLGLIWGGCKDRSGNSLDHINVPYLVLDVAVSEVFKDTRTLNRGYDAGLAYEAGSITFETRPYPCPKR